jgi:hypothetical protein
MRISINRNLAPLFCLFAELEHTYGSIIFKSQSVTKNGLLHAS